MSDAFIVRRGGGAGGIKNTDAVLAVSVPTGSTVTATKGGVVLTPTLWAKAANNTAEYALFVIPAKMFDSENAWSVTASLNTNTNTKTITISEAKEYELEIQYDFWLIKNGVVQSGISFSATSGATWSSNYQSGGYARLHHGAGVNSSGTSYACCTNAINFSNTPYKNLIVDCKADQATASASVGLSTSTSTSTGNFSASKKASTTRGTLTISTSSITSTLYFKVNVVYQDTSAGDLRIYNAYLSY